MRVSARLHASLALLAVVSALAGCGGGGAATTTSTTPADAPRARRGREADEFPLDAPTPVPGTGVTLRAPRGSEPVPYGAGFVHRTRRLQLMVASADGPPELIANVLEGMAQGAEEVEHEEVSVAGRTATLHVDQQEQGDIVLERVWLTLTEGSRAVVVAGAYDAERGERLRGLVRASLLTLAWDPTTPLDPEVAVGFRVDVPEGLTLDRSSTNSVTYGLPGAAMPPTPGSPALFVLPVGVQVPESQRDEACAAILAQAGPVPDDQVRTRSTIRQGELEGCEVTGFQDAELPDGSELSLATYAAVVFQGDATLLVAGMARDSERDTWLPRFAASARTVRGTRVEPTR